MEQRLRAVGVDPGRLNAILLTHEHSDHSRGAPRLATDHGVPVLATPGTLAALPPGEYEKRPVAYGVTTAVGDHEVSFFPVEHDSAEPAGIRLSRLGRVLAYLTDTGHVTPAVESGLHGAHHLLVESNHDPDLLRTGPYPERLKRRIQGGLGHLSNDACGALLGRILDPGVRRVVLHHLSRLNNTPELAVATNAAILHRLGRLPPALVAAPPDGPFGPFEL